MRPETCASKEEAPGVFHLTNLAIRQVEFQALSQISRCYQAGWSLHLEGGRKHLKVSKQNSDLTPIKRC